MRTITPCLCQLLQLPGNRFLELVITVGHMAFHRDLGALDVRITFRLSGAIGVSS